MSGNVHHLPQFQLAWFQLKYSKRWRQVKFPIDFQENDKKNEESDFNEVLLTCELRRMGRKIDLARQKSLDLKKNQKFWVAYHHFRKILGLAPNHYIGADAGLTSEVYFNKYVQIFPFLAGSRVLGLHVFMKEIL